MKQPESSGWADPDLEPTDNQKYVVPPLDAPVGLCIHPWGTACYRASHQSRSRQDSATKAHAVSRALKSVVATSKSRPEFVHFGPRNESRFDVDAPKVDESIFVLQ